MGRGVDLQQIPLAAELAEADAPSRIDVQFFHSSAAIVTVAGEIVLREHPAHGSLIFVRFYKVPPCPVPP